MKIIGQRICQHCKGLNVSLGQLPENPLAANLRADGQVVISLELRNVIGESGEFYLLECGHALHRLTPLWSSQEWHQNRPELVGQFPTLGAK